MTHFVEIDLNNVVLRGVVVADEHQHRGHDFLAHDLNLGGAWLQTSYNTFGGIHRLGGAPFRKNYAGIGYTYDASRDAFIPPKRYASWTLNEATCLWNAPIAYPSDGKHYIWDENTTA
jgi:hypothetical protein